MKPFRNAIMFPIIAALIASPLLCLQDDDAKLFDKAGPGMISLVATGANNETVGRGTGYHVTEELVATAYHVISRADSVDALNIKGRKVRVDGIVAFNKEMNTALIKVRGKTAPLALDTEWNPEKGTRVLIVGANESGELTHMEGVVRNTHQFDSVRRFYEIGASTPESFSGGVILAENGMVVAMMVSLERGVRIGIPASFVQGMSRTAAATAFKSRQTEDYFETLEGTLFAGQAALRMNEFMAARIHMEKAARLDPKQIEVHSALADIYMDQRDYTASIASYQKVLELDPKRADALTRLGSVFMRMQRYADAIEVLEKARALEPRNLQILFDLGGAYEETRDFAKAADIFHAYLNLNPEQVWPAYQRLGNTRMKLEQYDRAVEAFAAAALHNPDDPKIAFSLAEAYQKTGNLDKAEETFAKLAENNPDEAKSYYGQILKMYDEADMPEKAIEAARKIFELDPQNEYAGYNLGLMLQRVNRYKEAIDAFRSSLEVNPDFSAAWFNIGSCHMQLKNWAESVEAYKKYVDLSPDDPNGWMAMGVGYMQMKKFEDALDPLRRTVALQPQNAAAQFNLAVCYVNLNDHFSAREVLKVLEKLDRGFAERLRKVVR
ncbi:MAG: tetratricopeptide repeat protein [Acidobacteriota bacterium]|nr:tetratricopeptide repeat protein [Acidobacteriota bacterium]